MAHVIGVPGASALQQIVDRLRGRSRMTTPSQLEPYAPYIAPRIRPLYLFHWDDSPPVMMGWTIVFLACAAVGAIFPALYGDPSPYNHDSDAYRVALMIAVVVFAVTHIALKRKVKKANVALSHARAAYRDYRDMVDDYNEDQKKEWEKKVRNLRASDSNRAVDTVEEEFNALVQAKNPKFSDIALDSEATPWMIGAYGEYVTAQALEALDDRFTVVHDLTIFDDTTYQTVANIDHLVLADGFCVQVDSKVWSDLPTIDNGEITDPKHAHSALAVDLEHRSLRGSLSGVVFSLSGRSSRTISGIMSACSYRDPNSDESRPIMSHPDGGGHPLSIDFCAVSKLASHITYLYEMSEYDPDAMTVEDLNSPNLQVSTSAPFPI